MRTSLSNNKKKVIPSPTWQCHWKMKWIEFFQAQGQWAIAQSSTVAPHVSKHRGNTGRLRARCTLSLHSHTATDEHIGNGTPSLWYAPISRFPARGSEKLAKWPAGCEHLGGCAVQRAIWHGLQDLPFLCTNYSGHSDKSRGKWRSTCVWNSLNFITNHQGLTQGQAVWLLAQPRFHFRLIKVHSLPPVSLEGCDTSARRSKNTAPTVTLDWTPTNGVAATASLLWCVLPRYFCCS